MILYNITINISPNIEDEFIEWMKVDYIPRVLDTGYFYEHRFMRLLHQEPGEGINFSAQFHTKSLNEMRAFEERFAKGLRMDLERKFGDQFVSFRSLLASVE
jgi:hypothetical protein